MFFNLYAGHDCEICGRILVSIQHFDKYIKGTPGAANIGAGNIHHIWYGNPQVTMYVCQECHGHIHASRKTGKYQHLYQYLNQDSVHFPIDEGCPERPGRDMRKIEEKLASRRKLTADDFM